MDSQKKIRFKSVLPIMIYITPEDRDLLDWFTKKHKLNASQVAREGIRMRINTGGDNDYNKGFNEGLNAAVAAVAKTEAAGMRFPSGKSIGDLISENISSLARL